MSDSQGGNGRVRAQRAEMPPLTVCLIPMRPNPRAKVSGTQATPASSPPNPQSTNCSHLFWTSGKCRNFQSSLNDSVILVILEHSSVS